MIKGLFFDLDGTLCDTIEDLAYSTNYALKKCGCETHEVEKYKKFVGNGMQMQIKRALGKDQLEHFDKCVSLFLDHYASHCFDHTKPYPMMKELISQLKADGYKLAVITNKPQVVADKIVNALFPNTFEVIFGGCDDYPKKPDITSTNKALQLLILNHDEVIFIGDSYVDMETGNNANMKTIGCDWGFRGEEELKQAGATQIAYQTMDIKDILDDWNK